MQFVKSLIMPQSWLLFGNYNLKKNKLIVYKSKGVVKIYLFISISIDIDISTIKYFRKIMILDISKLKIDINI